MDKDMLVKLYELDSREMASLADGLATQGILLKRAMPHNKHRVLEYVECAFGKGWASECDVCFSNHPASCFVAVKDGAIVGFACYETTARDFFGPTGVSEEYRGRGIGKALLLKCLLAMREMGYGYAIIGDVGDAEGFYQKTVGAVPIPGSFPGVYADAIGIEEKVASQSVQDSRSTRVAKEEFK